MAIERSDRRVLFIALGVMIGMVLFGVGFGAFFAATQCRALEPIGTGAAETSVGDAMVLSAVAPLLGAPDLVLRLPLDDARRLGPHPDGIVVTGDGLLLIGPDGETRAGATFRRDVTVVGDGAASYAIVVGNLLTGQVDALRPLIATPEGVRPGACVDTSAVGSPLSFVHDAREGQFLGLRTDEDGTEAVLELRDPDRGRIWAPVLSLPRAPAGLQGSRTSAAIGADLVVLARRLAPTDGDEPAVLAFARSDGAQRWVLSAQDVRAMLPPGASVATADAIRLEVVHAVSARIVLSVTPDVALDAPLPAPSHGPLGGSTPAHADTVGLVLDARDGTLVDRVLGAPATGRDGDERAALRARVAATGVVFDDVLATEGATWLLRDGVLLRFGG